MPTRIFITASGNWTVPSDWNSANNTIEGIGGGGGSVGGNGGNFAIGGGGGGAYSKIANLALTPGAVIAVTVGGGGAGSVGGNGGDTVFRNTSTLVAKGGTGTGNSFGAIGGAGGSAAASVGNVKYSGGAGGNSWDALGNGGYGGGGGGGAAGPNGAGANGNNAVSSTQGGAGGRADAATGGNGGNGSSTGIGSAGAGGTEWDATHGAGGGGGGAGGNGVSGAFGGAGGSYGGGAGGSSEIGTLAGSSGGAGIIVITYTAAAPIPNPPTGLTATPNCDGSVDLACDADANATSYDFWRGTASGGPYGTHVGTSATPSIVDTSGLAGTKYFYIASASDASGTSGASTETSTTILSIPGAPSGVNVVGYSVNQVLLGWGAVAGAVSYNLKRSTSMAGPFVTVWSGASTSHLDAGLPQGDAYFYVVSAVGAGGCESANSAIVNSPVLGSGGKMTLFHGVNIQEVSTPITSPRAASASIPVIVGAAPVHRSNSTLANVLNTPVLCNSLADFVTAFGNSTQFSRYNLCEFAAVFFGLYNVGPAVFINVFDPTNVSMTTSVASESDNLVNGAYTIAHDVIWSDLVVKDSTGATTYTLNTDYTLSLDANENTVITRVATGAIASPTAALKLSYEYVNAAPVASTDVIGTANANGTFTGIAAIEAVYPLLGVVPGALLSPNFSQIPAVQAAMVAAALSINSLFTCMVIADIDSSTGQAPTYNLVTAWKNTNNYVQSRLIACWPKLQLGSTVYWYSSHVAGLLASTDADNGAIPFVSPSNKSLQMNGLVDGNGNAIRLTLTQADTLNQNGVVTAVQFNGWRCWGDRTAAYPSGTDPKDVFIPIRRMMKWIENNSVLLLWADLDMPINRRTVETAVDSVNTWFNGLIGKGALNFGQMAFLSSDNSPATLAAGQLTLRIAVTPPAPAEQINVIVQYDVNGNTAVFG